MDREPTETVDARARWIALMTRLKQPDRADAFDDLRRRHAESPRAYHTLAHVQAMLALLDGHDPPDREAVELAVWFHDAVYDPRASDNEERSADLAGRALEGWGLSPALAARVRDLILATKTHRAGDDAAKAWLLDADLAVLGAASDAYDRYARAIREEYAWVPEEAYRTGRAQVLSGFLERGAIYHTPELRARFEGSARANLARERAALVGRATADGREGWSGA